MPPETRVPDEEEWRLAVFVGCGSPAEGFGNEAPGHGSPPSDEVGGAAVDLVACLVDDETEATDAVLPRRDEEPALLGPRSPLAAERGDDLDEAGHALRGDGRGDEPVVGVLALERTPVLLTGLAGLQDRAEDRLPGIRPRVLHGALGAATLEGGEVMREGDRDRCPALILFVPAALGAQQRMDLPIAGGRDVKAAMAGCRVEDDVLGIERAALRGAPRRAGARANFLATERALLALVLSIFEHAGAKRRLVGELAGVTVEIVTRPLAHRTPEAPRCDEVVPVVARLRHGEGGVADPRDAHAVGTRAERNPRESWGLGLRVNRRGSVHAAVLPSTISAPTSSAVTSWSTARGYPWRVSHSRASSSLAPR